MRRIAVVRLVEENMKKTASSHPSRQQMLEASKSGNIPFSNHLKHCSTCRDLFEFLGSALFQRKISDEKASDRLLTECTQIPLLERSRLATKSRRGQLTSDSWVGMPAAVLRDAASGMERRIRLTCGSLVLDLVAERRPDGWDFSARVYESRKVASRNYVLQAGRQKLLAGSRGVYTWTANHPPGIIRLLSPEQQINFDRLDWKASDR